MLLGLVVEIWYKFSAMEKIQGVQHVDYRSQLTPAGVAHYKNQGVFLQEDGQNRFWCDGLADSQYVRSIEAKVVLESDGSTHTITGRNYPVVLQQIRTLLKAEPQPAEV